MDDTMFTLAARTKCRLVLMHNAAHQGAQQNDIVGGEYNAPDYQNIIEDVKTELQKLIDRACQAGIPKDKLILDPGIGFGKSLEQTLAIIAHLDTFSNLGYPVMLAASRKSFIGRILKTKPNDRLAGDAAITAIAAIKGADILRVHDVAFLSRVVKIATAVRNTA